MWLGHTHLSPNLYVTWCFFLRFGRSFLIFFFSFCTIHNILEPSHHSQWHQRRRPTLSPPTRTCPSDLSPVMVRLPISAHLQHSSRNWSLTISLPRRERFRRCPYLRLFQRYLRPRYRSQVRISPEPIFATWVLCRMRLGYRNRGQI